MGVNKKRRSFAALVLTLCFRQWQINRDFPAAYGYGTVAYWSFQAYNTTILTLCIVASAEYTYDMSETLAPAVYCDLPQITNRKNIYSHLTGLRERQFPGFLIRMNRRCYDSVQAVGRHHDIVEDVYRAMQRDTGLDFDVHSLDDFNGLGQNEVGEFHEDVANVQVENALGTHFSPYVHTTTSGGGDVFMAFCGSRPDLVEAYSDTNFYEENPQSDPHSLLLRGLVDVRLTNPLVYRSSVQAGDTVVFTGTGPGIPWHRFDTNKALGERLIVATEVMHPDV